jgi:hypothetical protein
VLSLGKQPLSNKLPELSASGADPVYPLEFRVCSECGLGQIGEYVSPNDIFDDYTYFSSTSASWLEHAKSFAVDIAERLELGNNELVVEVASNDGYLLQYFQELGCQVLGIEPAKNVALAANKKGINTEISFFGEKVAQELIERRLIPKLVVCNNVMAHVPDLNDFLSGLALLINNGAIVSVEAPSMLVMLRDNLFDTIYHEHFSYLSATSVNFLATRHNIKLFDIEEISTHGGSYRFWIGPMESKQSSEVAKILNDEEQFGILTDSVQLEFARRSKEAIANFAVWCRNQTKPLIGYGAAAKATVLLNASGISTNEIVAIVDNSTSKQNRMVPGVRIPILEAREVFSRSRGNLVIFPWNIAVEIAAQIKMEFPNFNGEVWIPLPGMKKIEN